MDDIRITGGGSSLVEKHFNRISGHSEVLIVEQCGNFLGIHIKEGKGYKKKLTTAPIFTEWSNILEFRNYMMQKRICRVEQIFGIILEVSIGDINISKTTHYTNRWFGCLQNLSNATRSDIFYTTRQSGGTDLRNNVVSFN